MQHDEIVGLTSEMTMPSPDHARITIRKIGLNHRLILKDFFPILTQNLGEEASLIQIPFQFRYSHTFEQRAITNGLFLSANYLKDSPRTNQT